MSNQLDTRTIIHFLANEFELDIASMNHILNIISLPNHKLDTPLIKNIFKILINYTYKLKKSEIAMSEKYEKNFNEINAAIKEIKEEMKKIIKEPTPPEVTPS